MSHPSKTPAVEIVEGIGKVPREQWNSMLGENDSPFLDWDWLHALEESRSAARNTGWAPYLSLIHI